MKQNLFILLLFSCFFSGYSQETFMYRLILKDKGNPHFSTEQPEMFLSEKSIGRRIKQKLAVDSVDLPIDTAYLNAIANTGANIYAHSKWVKTVVVHISDSSLIPQLKNLPFLDTLYCVWKGILPQKAIFQSNEEYTLSNTTENNPNSYGVGFTQISLNNGHLLHNAGFRGKGMTIAVIDGGFNNADLIDYFDFQKVKAVKNFNHEVSNPLRSGEDHGTKTLSCMLSNKQGELIGTAPEADYYLLRTEISALEYPVEEDYWISALEYADSIGADIVTSSLGYAYFTDTLMNHKHNQLDGKTIPISIAASLAASRGILLFNSAGNERNSTWKKIMFPGDAMNMLTIGSITGDSTLSAFSSLGFTADNRIKPDLVAMGTSAAVVAGDGRIVYANGTSFSTPILAGLSACLWQALPELNCLEIIELLQKTADGFSKPDSLTGFGIANVYKAYTQNKTELKPSGAENAVYFYVNARENRLYLNYNYLPENSKFVLNIYSGVGNKLLSVSNASSPIDISSLRKGIYIARLQTGGKPIFTGKFVKM